MKGFSFIIAFLILHTPLRAQLEAGKRMITADMHYFLQREKQATDVALISKSSSTLNTVLSAGYFFRREFTVGFQMGISGLRTSSTETKVNSVRKLDEGIALFLFGLVPRWYSALGNHVALFLQAEVRVEQGGGMLSDSYSHDGVKFTGNTRDLRMSGASAALRPGVSWFISKYFSVEAMTGSLRYSRHVKKDLNAGLVYDETQGINASIGFSDLYLGLCAHF